MNQLNICLNILVQNRTQFFLYTLINFLQQINRIIGIHFIDNCRQFINPDFLNIIFRFLNKSKNFRYPFRI